eukprot:scaffold207667_cov29-Tisochrysis_lutea.AAC.6
MMEARLLLSRMPKTNDIKLTPLMRAHAGRPANAIACPICVGCRATAVLCPAEAVLTFRSRWMME